MSYDIWLEIDTGGESPAALTDTWSPTFNLGAMFRLALGHRLTEFNGTLGRDAIPTLENAILEMLKNPAMFKELNPPNGWGSYEGALEFLNELLIACTHHPKATIRA